MAERKRFYALLLCAVLVLALSVSTVFILHEADHDCTGEDCPICRDIALHISLLKAAGLAALTAPALFSVPAAFANRRRRDRYAPCRPGTLVSWKIRLDD